MKEEQIFNFQIKGIEILETSIKEPKTPINSNTVFGFDIKVEQRFNIEKKLGIITCIININNENTANLGHIKASCLFHIENIDKFIDKEKNTVTLPEKIVIMLNSVAISTVRGLMYGIFRGTFLNGAILPIVNPEGFKKQK